MRCSPQLFDFAPEPVPSPDTHGAFTPTLQTYILCIYLRRLLLLTVLSDRQIG